MSSTEPETTSTEPEQDLHEYQIDVAMDVRVYGSVTIEAASLEEAAALATPAFIAENFELNSGSESMDRSSPSGIWLGEVIVDGDHDGTEFIEEDLPDDASVSNVTSLTLADARIVFAAMAGVGMHSDEAIAIRDRLQAYLATAKEA